MTNSYKQTHAHTVNATRSTRTTCCKNRASYRVVRKTLQTAGLQHFQHAENAQNTGLRTGSEAKHTGSYASVTVLLLLLLLEKQRLRPGLQQQVLKRIWVTRPALEPVRVDMEVLWVCGITATADFSGLVVMTPLKNNTRGLSLCFSNKEEKTTYEKIARTILSIVLYDPPKSNIRGLSLCFSNKGETNNLWKTAWMLLFRLPPENNTRGLSLCFSQRCCLQPPLKTTHGASIFVSPSAVVYTLP